MPRKLVFLLPLLTALTFAQTSAPVKVPDATPDFRYFLDHFREEPATFPLVATGEGAHIGKIWVRKLGEGLAIVGHVDGPLPSFPTTNDTLVTGERVEIWLSQQPNPHFPAMGWGNQHGDVELADDSACPAALHMQNDPDAREIRACREWFQQQLEYRTQLRRLFTRHWLLAPHLFLETLATPAHEQIGSADIDHDVLAALMPKAGPFFGFDRAVSDGYDFHILIPWHALPPIDTADLKDLYLMVEVIGPNGAVSTTTPGHTADFSTFSRIHFEHPQHYEISPCHYPAIGRSFFDRALPGYFLPTDDGIVAKTFVLENDRRGYMDEAGGVSPNLTPTTFFSKPLQQGGSVCGPLLRIQTTGEPVDLTMKPAKETLPIIVEQDSMDVLELPEGLLVRNGPRVSTSRFGAGACGMCSRAELEIYSVDKSMRATEQVHIYDIIDPSVAVDDADLQIAKDWNRVGYYRHQQGKDPATGAQRDEFEWDGQFYCRKDLTYTKCGENPAIPSDPRTLNFAK